jgi:hypothetical protein
MNLGYRANGKPWKSYAHRFSLLAWSRRGGGFVRGQESLNRLWPHTQRCRHCAAFDPAHLKPREVLTDRVVDCSLPPTEVGQGGERRGFGGGVLRVARHHLLEFCRCRRYRFDDPPGGAGAHLGGGAEADLVASLGVVDSHF